MIRVFAIDPGTDHTGVALVDDHGVSCCQTIRFLEPCGRDNRAIIRRAGEIAKRLEPLLAAWRHDVVVMEGWEYYPSQNNANSATQTPVLVGYLASFLQDENLHPQTSAEVFNRYRKTNVYSTYGVSTADPNDKRLRELMRRIPDGQKAKDEHQRAAVAHAVYYIREHERLGLNGMGD